MREMREGSALQGKVQQLQQIRLQELQQVQQERLENRTPHNLQGLLGENPEKESLGAGVKRQNWVNATKNE